MSSHPAGGTAGVGDPPLLNIANALTVLRLPLVPVFVVALFVDGGEDVVWRLVAFAVFVIAAATDRLDGQLARSRGLVTWFGALVDPIADKALMGAALIGLSLLGVLPWWVTIVIVVRETEISSSSSSSSASSSSSSPSRSQVVPSPSSSSTA